MPGEQIRVIVRGEHAVVICRQFEVACPMACLASVQDAIEQFRAAFDAPPSSVLVSRRKKDRRGGVPYHLAPGDVTLLNLCGKITHATNTDNAIFSPGSLHLHRRPFLGVYVYSHSRTRAGAIPLLARVTDGFGVRLSAATVYGNFVTSPHANTTLFRGCKRCSDVHAAIDLIFRAGAVHEVVIHMVVAMAVLPHAVPMAATQITRALLDNPAWRAETPARLEDNVYMKPVQLSCAGKKVLVHVYATGAIFFFITCTDKTVMRPDSELDFVRLCRDIYACVARVC